MNYLKLTTLSVLSLLSINAFSAGGFHMECQVREDGYIIQKFQSIDFVTAGSTVKAYEGRGSVSLTANEENGQIASITLRDNQSSSTSTSSANLGLGLDQESEVVLNNVKLSPENKQDADGTEYLSDPSSSNSGTVICRISMKEAGKTKEDFSNLFGR